jgi:hypothetical protein
VIENKKIKEAPKKEGTKGLPTLEGTEGLPTLDGTEGLPTLDGTEGLPTLKGTEGIPTLEGTEGFRTVKTFVLHSQFTEGHCKLSLKIFSRKLLPVISDFDFKRSFKLSK